MESICIIVCSLLAIAGVCRLCGARGAVEYVLLGYVVGIACIAVWGTVLSGLDAFGDLRGYLVLSAVTAAGVWLGVFASRRYRQTHPAGDDGVGSVGQPEADRGNGRHVRLLTGALLVTAGIAGLINLLVVVGCAPNNWDSLCYHLARVAFYLQQRSMRPFGANYFAQELTAKAVPAVLAFLYVVTGRAENLMQLLGFGSYVTAVVAVYGIARRCGCLRGHALLAAGFAAILTEWLMQATSTQDHMPLTACVGALVYFLLAYRQAGDGRYLAMAAMTAGVAFAVKSTFLLAVPSVALVAAESLAFRSRRVSTFVRDGFLFAATAAMFVGMAVFIGGYAENLARYGNVVGPRFVVDSHSSAGQSLADRPRSLLLNAARYGIEFLSLDGAPDFVRPLVRLQIAVRGMAARACAWVGLDVQCAEAKRYDFNIARAPCSAEDTSYWGILGFGLILPLVAAVACARSAPRPLRVLAVAAGVFFLVQAFACPYSPWQGRYFSTMAIFAVPVAAEVGRWRSPLWRGYAIALTAIACLFAISAVTFRPDCRVNPPLFGGSSQPFWKLSRIEQLSLPPHNSNPEEFEMLRTFDRVVPRDAVVALALLGNTPEYALFGEHLTRTLIPMNSFEAGPYGSLQPIPERAEWLLFSATVDIAPEPGDMQLPKLPGQDVFYLRRLR